MKYTIDKNTGTPVYLQLYNQLKTDIVKGVLPFGAKLPSKRFTADELGISVITVEHSYTLLLDDGYISSAPRSGYYVSFSLDVHRDRGVERHFLVTDNVEHISSAPDFPFSSYAKIMRRVLNEYDDGILKKSDNRGCPELRNAIAGYLGRSRGIIVSGEQIIIGSGAEYLYGIVVQLLGRSSLYAVEYPCYEKIRLVYEANGAHCVGLPLGRDGIKSSALESCTAGIMHVTPYNSFPSGITASASKRHEYASWACAGQRYIIEDDYDSELSSSLRQIDTIYSLAPDRTIYINTFSKTISPSFRTGYMVLPEKLLEEYITRLGFYSCTVPLYEQYVLAEFINGGEFERHINRVRRKQRKNLQP